MSDDTIGFVKIIEFVNRVTRSDLEKMDLLELQILDNELSNLRLDIIRVARRKSVKEL